MKGGGGDILCKHFGENKSFSWSVYQGLARMNNKQLIPKAVFQPPPLPMISTGYWLILFQPPIYQMVAAM